MFRETIEERLAIILTNYLIILISGQIIWLPGEQLSKSPNGRLSMSDKWKRGLDLPEIE